jgi:hypothetical protein
LYDGQQPEIGPLGYIWEYISEAGLLTSWQEIRAWSELTGSYLETWEAALIWKISTAYLNQLQKSSDVSCPCPVVSTEQKDAAAIDKKIKSVMRSINK